MERKELGLHTSQELTPIRVPCWVSVDYSFYNKTFYLLSAHQSHHVGLHSATQTNHNANVVALTCLPLKSHQIGGSDKSCYKKIVEPANFANAHSSEYTWLHCSLS